MLSLSRKFSKHFLKMESDDTVRAEYHKVLQSAKDEIKLLGELLKVNIYCDETTLDCLIENSKTKIDSMAHPEELQPLLQGEQNNGKTCKYILKLLFCDYFTTF